METFLPSFDSDHGHSSRCTYFRQAGLPWRWSGCCHGRHPHILADQILHHLIFSLFNLQSDIFNENHWTVFKNSKNWEYYSHLSISYLRAQKIRLHSARLAVWQISSFGRVQWKKVSWVSNLLSAKTRLFWKKRRKYKKKNRSKLIVLILNNFKYNIVHC